MSTKTDNPAHVGLHVFERAGLGKAPFRVTGFTVKTFKASPDSPTQPGTSCDFCGTGIMNVCLIKSSDGKAFKVGCDCVAKTGDAGLLKQFKNLPEVRAANRTKARNKDAATVAEWNATIDAPETLAALGNVTVPGRPWVPGERVPMLDSLKRLWSMCGASGRLRTLKQLKQQIATGQQAGKLGAEWRGSSTTEGSK